LTDQIAALVREMPEKKAFRKVTLVEPEETDPDKVAEAETERDGEPGEEDGKPGEGKDSVEQIDEPGDDDEEDDDTLMYVGIGGAAVVAAGLVTGGILLFGGSKSRPGGFEANVSW